MRLLLLLFAPWLCCLIAAGQTNCSSDLSRLFSFHNLELRSPIAGKETNSDSVVEAGPRLFESLGTSSFGLAPSTPLVTIDRFTAELTMDNFRFESERRMYRQLDEGGYLTRNSEPEKDFDYYFGRVFEPEVFNVGKKTLSC